MPDPKALNRQYACLLPIPVNTVLIASPFIAFHCREEIMETEEWEPEGNTNLGKSQKKVILVECRPAGLLKKKKNFLETKKSIKKIQ